MVIGHSREILYLPIIFYVPDYSSRIMSLGVEVTDRVNNVNIVSIDIG